MNWPKMSRPVSSNRPAKKIKPLFSADDFLKEANEIDYDRMMDGRCELTDEGCKKLSEMLRYAYAFIRANS